MIEPLASQRRMPLRPLDERLAVPLLKVENDNQGDRSPESV